MRSEIASFLVTKSLIRDSEVIHDGLELILRSQAGIKQISFTCPKTLDLSGFSPFFRFLVRPFYALFV